MMFFSTAPVMDFISATCRESQISSRHFSRYRPVPSYVVDPERFGRAGLDPHEYEYLWHVDCIN